MLPHRNASWAVGSSVTRGRWVGFVVLLFACGGGDGSVPGLDGGMDLGRPVPDAAPVLDARPVPMDAADGFVMDDLGTDMAPTDGGTCTCPEPTECVSYACDDTFTCVPTASAAGTVCALDETTNGICIEGACTVRGCGDTYVEPGPDPAAEGCDDGNTSPDDLCAADCTSPTTLEVSQIGLDDTTEHHAFDQAPMVGVDGDGEVLLVWSLEGIDGSMPLLSGRRFDRHGSPIGSAFPIETDRHLRPVVVGLRGGGFVVAYANFDGHVRFRIVSGAGSVGTERRVSVDPDSISERNATLAALASGGFVLAWADGRSRPGVDPAGGAYFRRFDASGTALDPMERRVAANAAGRERDPRVASDGDSFAIAWIDESPTFSERRIQLRHFDGATGDPMDVSDLDVSSDGDFVHEPMVTALTPPRPVAGAEADGSYLVSWRIQGGAAPGIYGRRFDVGASPTAAVFVVDGEEATVAPLQSIVAPDGSVARHYLLTYLTGEVFGGADVIATRPVPMSIDTLRVELDLTEAGFGVVAGPTGLWFHYFRTFDLNHDQFRLFHLPVR